MKKHARMLFLLFCVTSLFIFSLTTAAATHAAPPRFPLTGGCNDNGIIQICITETGPFIEAYTVLDIHATTCQVTVVLNDTDFNGQIVTVGPADCTKATVTATLPVITNHDYGAEVSGIVNGQSVLVDSPDQTG